MDEHPLDIEEMLKASLDGARRLRKHLQDAAEERHRLTAELVEARATNAKLNRRCQEAEGAARARVEEIQRAGLSLGRGLANFAAGDYKRQLDDLLSRAQTAIALEDAVLNLEDASEALGAHNDACHECETHDDRGNCEEGCRLDAAVADLDEAHRAALAATRAAREARKACPHGYDRLANCPACKP